MTRRIQKINQLIKKEISQLLFKEVEFPRDTLVTVTRVVTSPDFLESKVYVSVMPEERFKKILEILNQKIYELQQKINKRLKMRPVPRIKFKEEKATSQAAKIEELLERIKKTTT